ncbi:MAG: hypothetical protein Q4B73_00585 [Lachnospiraceae bacterium]|nr:hypothetical protein [Lachnospiraceae bacterium]
MAKIGLTDGFTLIPKGIHVFLITEVKYKEDFGKMEVTMQNAAGQKHTERFSLLNKDGEPNQGGLNAFSYFAKTALNDYGLSEIDHEDLVGCYIRCEVDHEKVESNRTPGKFLDFVRLGNKEPADGFDTPVAEKKPAAAQSNAAPAQKGKKFDLNSILGN